MKFKETLKNAITIMLNFMKIGLFAFGGGPTMLSFMHSEFIVKRRYLDDEELAELTAISESTPGPIAINLATYLGYKRAGLLGAILATFGVIFPSFIIIFIIFLFLSQFLENEYVKYAFNGVKCGVIYLIIRVGISLLKGLKKDVMSIIIFSLALCLLIFFTIFAISVSAIFFVLAGALIGLIYYALIKVQIEKKKENKK